MPSLEEETSVDFLFVTLINDNRERCRRVLCDSKDVDEEMGVDAGEAKLDGVGEFGVMGICDSVGNPPSALAKCLMNSAI